MQTSVEEYTFVQDPPQEVFSEQVEERLEKAWKDLTSFTFELYNFADDKDFTDPEQEMMEYEDKYLFSQAYLLDRCKI